MESCLNNVGMVTTATSDVAMEDIGEYFAALTRFGVKPGLERMRFLLNRLDHPEAQYPVVLVGGTNGKGSVVEFVASILQTAGYRTAAYTSPHIWRYNERIRVNGQEISDEALGGLLRQTMPHIEAARSEPRLGEVTEFEVLTLMAFLFFAEQDIDVAIMEVGLGGRWDATNAADPVLSIITHVALDHTDRLGNDLLSISQEKIPIIRPGRPLLTAERNGDVVSVFRTACQETGADMRRLSQECDYQIMGETPAGIELRLQTPNHCYERLRSSMPGSFQAENIALAVLAAESLADASGEVEPAHDFAGFRLSYEDIGEGISAARLPGRFQILRDNPTVILDGANNPEGAARLAENLRRLYGDRNILLVVGIADDKDVESMVEALAPVATRFIATQADHWRAAKAERIAAAATRGCPETQIVRPVKQATELAVGEAEPEDVVCVAGSFYVLGEVERSW